MIKVAVLGYGNIGSGVVQVLLKNKETIAKKAGDEIVPACVLDLRDFPGDVMEDKVVKDINLITQNPEISIVVETMGGTKPAYAFVKACLEAGKHVATSNKELVAAHGPELLEIAKICSRVPAKPAANGNGQYVVLIGAFSNPANVKQLQSKLGELSIPVFTEPLDTPDGRKTRVRAGPFGGREAAERALDKMKRIGVGGVVAAKQ